MCYFHKSIYHSYLYKYFAQRRVRSKNILLTTKHPTKHKQNMQVIQICKEHINGYII